MKTLAGKIALVAVFVVALPPFVATAQNIASKPGTVNRGLERLTLLPGPKLLSPARGAPQSGPSITIYPAAVDMSSASSVYFTPAINTSYSAGHGVLSLRPSATGTMTFSPAGNGEQPDANAPKTAPTPDPDALRFDSTLHAPNPSLRLEGRPATKL